MSRLSPLLFRQHVLVYLVSQLLLASVLLALGFSWSALGVLVGTAALFPTTVELASSRIDYFGGAR